MNRYLDIAPEVQQAVAEGRPVVALESTILSHGMPYPENLTFAAEVERIIRAFCDSPYLSQEDYADALSALIELFDTVKTETDDRISDEALIEEMRAAFDGVCHGSLELLADEVLSRVVRRVNARGGAEWKMTEDT